MLWLQIFVPLATLAGALLILRKDVRDGKHEGDRVRRVIAPAILILTTLATCAFIYVKDLDARNARLETAAAQRDATVKIAEARSQLDRIEGRLGSGEMAQRYLETMRKLTQEYAATNTTAAVDRYFDREAERQHLRAQEEKANEKARAEFELQVQPVIDLVFAKVDAWVEGVRKRGVSVEMTANTRPIVIVGRPTSWETVRQLRFSNDTEFTLQIYAASVEGGAVSHRKSIGDRRSLIQSGRTLRYSQIRILSRGNIDPTTLEVCRLN